MTDRTTVYLVGAGPGDPELLTVKAKRVIEAADVVVYDRLVSPEIMALVPPGAARFNVGKQPHNHPVPQTEINELLVALARDGRTVVRLKGGDPFLFGRGSEEAAALRHHGVPYEVIPGITSASGCAAALRMPLTHRGISTGVRFVTGHCRDDIDLDFDWRGLADSQTTLVIYMGMANMADIVGKLIAYGLSAETPAVAIASGTTPRQRHVVAPIGEIVAAAEGFDGPVLFIVGQVAALADIPVLEREGNANVESPMCVGVR